MSETKLDFDAVYRVESRPGIAWRIKRYQTVRVWDNEKGWFEDEEDHEWVLAVMVGDDQEHEVEVADLTKIGENSYCHECGQIGCGHD